jgi:hypothetical protein
MTKKDFEFIAKTIKGIDAEAVGGAQGKFNVAETFAYKLAETNPRFDPHRFIKACGVTD